MKRLILSVCLLSFLAFSMPVQAVDYVRTPEQSRVESFLEGITTPLIAIGSIGVSLLSYYLCFCILKNKNS